MILINSIDLIVILKIILIKKGWNIECNWIKIIFTLIKYFIGNIKNLKWSQFDKIILFLINFFTFLKFTKNIKKKY